MDVGQVESQVQQVGGVWMVAAVEIKDKYKVGAKSFEIPVKNAFSALGEVEARTHYKKSAIDNTSGEVEASTHFKKASRESEAS